METANAVGTRKRVFVSPQKVCGQNTKREKGKTRKPNKKGSHVFFRCCPPPLLVLSFFNFYEKGVSRIVSALIATMPITICVPVQKKKDFFCLRERGFLGVWVGSLSFRFLFFSCNFFFFRTITKKKKT